MNSPKSSNEGQELSNEGQKSSKIFKRLNEKVNSALNCSELVFLILSNFFEDNLYKSTLKSVIIRVIKSVC